MKLVDEARNAWKWFSVQAMALAAAVQITWAGLPPEMKVAIPTGVVTGLTIGLLLLGIGGRMVKQGPKGE